METRTRANDCRARRRKHAHWDYVRESLFNIIRWDVEGRRVLDLFAGTGALSLEALSRSAKGEADAGRYGSCRIRGNP